MALRVGSIAGGTDIAFGEAGILSADWNTTLNDTTTYRTIKSFAGAGSLTHTGDTNFTAVGGSVVFGGVSGLMTGIRYNANLKITNTSFQASCQILISGATLGLRYFMAAQTRIQAIGADLDSYAPTIGSTSSFLFNNNTTSITSHGATAAPSLMLKDASTVAFLRIRTSSAAHTTTISADELAIQWTKAFADV